jgi:hypothetical protein
VRYATVTHERYLRPLVFEGKSPGAALARGDHLMGRCERAYPIRARLDRLATETTPVKGDCNHTLQSTDEIRFNPLHQTPPPRCCCLLLRVYQIGALLTRGSTAARTATSRGRAHLTASLIGSEIAA